MLVLLFCHVIILIGGGITAVQGRRLPGLEFRTQPQDTAVIPGTTVVLTCDTNYLRGKPAEFYWILNGSKLVLSNVVEVRKSLYNLSRSNGDLRIENIREKAYGVYQCVAQYYGSAIISRKAHVRMPYLYRTGAPPPTNLVCYETNACLLKPPDLVSFPEPSVLWEYRRYTNETFIEIGKRRLGRLDSSLALSLEGTLCILGLQQSDQGQYRCVIANDAGTVVQLYNVTAGETNVSMHQLSVLAKPKNVTVAASLSASFDCISSEKNTQIRWLKGDKIVDTGGNYDLSLPHRLTVKQATLDDEGWYTCVVSNNFTMVEQKAFLNVRDTVELMTDWPNTQEILKDKVLVLKATANHGIIEWYWNGLPLDDNALNGSLPSITRRVAKLGGEIVKDEQTLRLESMSLRGIYQVLATGFNNKQVSKHTEVITYGCGGILTTRNGTFNIPNFPGPYPRNTECLWIIKPHPKRNDGTLFLEINHFDVGGDTCRHDLKIRDGETRTSQMFSFPLGKPFSSHLSAFRLFFKSGSCDIRHRGFNATYWVEVPTVPPVSTTEPTSLQTEHETNQGSTIFIKKTITDTIHSQNTEPISLSALFTRKITTAARTTRQNEDSKEHTSSGSNVIVYGVVVFLCVLFIVVALLLLIRRKGNFFLICIKGTKSDARRDTERNEHELHHYASTDEIIPSSVYDTPGDKDSSRQPTNQAQESPIYAVLENPYSAIERDLGPDQSKNIYATVNEGVDKETLYPSGNFEVSFLEEIYTTLAADRGEQDVNIYESLCDAKTQNERSDSWSVQGMQSIDQDYVSVIG